jgi:cysteinyl-tRNA synthetase
MIQIYDSLRGEKVAFHKKPGDSVGMYVCGPTIYDFAHLGHGRSAVAFDLVRRFLVYSGYEVSFVFNYTDIEDKMIKRAAEEGITVKALADRIGPYYDEDYAKLGILPPDHNPYATDFIPEMIQVIQSLEEKGHTYLLEDGVYFDISSFKDYGKLSHQKLDELEAGARVDAHESKRNHQDFVLWKFKKEGEPSWSSPWGEGRPGWHIECSAMNSTLLGKSFDIHGGGLDLKFPHHECEIAQSEGAFEQEMCQIWMHNGYITVNEEKMSKSLNNFFTLRDIFKQYHPRVVRFFLLGTHYRSPIEYNDDMLVQARNTLKRLDDFYLLNKDGSDESKGEVDEVVCRGFYEKMANDFDVAGALSVIFEWINSAPSINVQGTLERINQVLNVMPLDFELTGQQQTLVDQRAKARNNKDWGKSDALRDQLAEMGIELEDRPEGPLAKPLI